MKFIRLTEQRINQDISELKVNSVEKKLAQYKQKWLYHISRMEDIRYSTHQLDYRHICRQPLQRLLEG